MFGFRGSVRFRDGSPLVHAISRRDYSFTVCGYMMNKHVDHWGMNVNGEMELPTCFACWTTPDPRP